MKSLFEIKKIVESNRAAGRFTYETLSSAEIGEYNRDLMFGADEDAEEFDRNSWSLIVD